MILFKIAQKVNNIFVSKFVAKKFQKSGHTADVSTTKLFQIFAKNEIFLDDDGNWDPNVSSIPSYGEIELIDSF